MARVSFQEYELLAVVLAVLCLASTQHLLAPSVEALEKQDPPVFRAYRRAAGWAFLGVVLALVLGWLSAIAASTPVATRAQWQAFGVAGPFFCALLWAKWFYLATRWTDAWTDVRTSIDQRIDQAIISYLSSSEPYSAGEAAKITAYHIFDGVRLRLFYLAWPVPMNVGANDNPLSEIGEIVQPLVINRDRVDQRLAELVRTGTLIVRDGQYMFPASRPREELSLLERAALWLGRRR